MEFKDIAKKFANEYINGIKKKAKIVAVIVVVFLVILISILGGGDDSDVQAAGSYISLGGTSALSEYLASWENNSMRQYINGTIIDYNSSPYIYMCITEDKTQYIMQDDLFTGNENRNYGFGVCFYVGSSASFQNTTYFKEEGIDITTQEYNVYGESKISIEIVNRIKEKIIESKREEARQAAKSRGLSLTDYQIDAIAACRYQGWIMSDFLDAYKEYGLDETIRSKSTGMGTSNPRFEANWKLFSTGKYIGPDGKEIKIASQGTIANASGSGYTKSITVGNKIYLVYNQGYYGGNIAQAGCSITSEAIVASAYKPDLGYTPETLANKYSYPRSLSQIASDLTSFGIESTSRVTYNADSNSTVHNTAIQEIKNNLLNGRPVIILVRSGADNKYTASAHYMVLVGYNESGYPIIADSNGGKCRTESTLEDIVKKYIYAYAQTGREQGYILINK